MADDMEGLRGYLRTLRQRQEISQEDLAKNIGKSRRALIDWEMGRTHDLKAASLDRAITFLKARADQVAYLISSKAPKEVGIQMANDLADELAALVAEGHSPEEIAAAIDEADQEK